MNQFEKHLPSKEELTLAFNFMKGVEIPKIPEAVLALQQETAKREPDIKKIGEILALDIALSGMALKTINSASFGLRHQIDSISQATVLLGLNTLKEVILVSSLKQTLGEVTPFQTTIWRGAQGCALGAKALSFDIDGISPEAAYIAGLFHDVGALIIEKKHPEYPEIYKKGLAYPLSALEEENKRYGTNHAVIGYLLAKHWKLPDNVCITIYNSHINTSSVLDDQEIKAMISILKITENTSARMLYPGLEFSNEANNSLAEAYMELIVDVDALEAMTEKVGQGVW